jgi:hypothetical protein
MTLARGGNEATFSVHATRKSPVSFGAGLFLCPPNGSLTRCDTAAKNENRRSAPCRSLRIPIYTFISCTTHNLVR